MAFLINKIVINRILTFLFKPFVNTKTATISCSGFQQSTKTSYCGITTLSIA